MIEWMVYQVHRLLSAADRLDQIVLVGTGPVRICFRPLEQQATKAAFFGAGIIRRIKFLFGHRHSPVKNEAGLMKQFGSVQMKRNDAPAAMENRLGTNAHLPVYLSSI